MPATTSIGDTWSADSIRPGAQPRRGANDDTFFFTNCSPQHARFNQSLWAELEDYLLNSADTRGFRASVFTGPVFTPEDPPYRGVRLPAAYWKVAAMVREDGLTRIHRPP